MLGKSVPASEKGHLGSFENCFGAINLFVALNSAPNEFIAPKCILVYLKLDDNSRFELLGTSYMDTGRLRVYWTKGTSITLFILGNQYIIYIPGICVFNLIVRAMKRGTR